MFLTDSEIAELCRPLVQPAAQVRYLRSLGLQVTVKPNGRAVVVRSHAEAVLSGNRPSSIEPVAAQGTQRPDREGLLRLLGGRHGAKAKAQPA